ncbi:MAG: two-component regulator propeller domain-containing protein, partial [Bacteroidota bacterium]
MATLSHTRWGGTIMMGVLPLLFLSVALPAQDFIYRHYTIDDGLPSSEVFDILQDRQGYIWLSTDNGISRFDGYAFRNFNSAEGLGDPVVFNIKEDQEGR